MNLGTVALNVEEDYNIKERFLRTVRIIFNFHSKFKCQNVKVYVFKNYVGTKKAPRQATGFSLYVREHFQTIRKKLGKSVSHADVMVRLANDYKAYKAASEIGSPGGL